MVPLQVMLIFEGFYTLIRQGTLQNAGQFLLHILCLHKCRTQSNTEITWYVEWMIFSTFFLLTEFSEYFNVKKSDERKRNQTQRIMGKGGLLHVKVQVSPGIFESTALVSFEGFCECIMEDSYLPGSTYLTFLQMVVPSFAIPAITYSEKQRHI